MSEASTLPHNDLEGIHVSIFEVLVDDDRTPILSLDLAFLFEFDGGFKYHGPQLLVDYPEPSARTTQPSRPQRKPDVNLGM